jgi:hypothetical protein
MSNEKIEIDSIYDHTDNYNKTRFSQPVTKFTKTSKLLIFIIFVNIDMPVTFHKKIKSSGYGKTPSALKYSAKQKQKVQQQ